MLSPRKAISCYAILSVLLFWGNAAVAGTISGTVKDSGGSPFKGAFVQARNLKAKMTTSALSDKQGRYRIENLAVGDYEVKAVATGYKSDPRTGLKLDSGQSESLDFTLQKANVRWGELSVYHNKTLLPEGKGKSVMFGTCMACHGVSSRMTRRSEQGWIDAVNYMRTAFKYFLVGRVSDSEAADVTSYLIRVFGEDSDLPRYPEVKRPEFSDEAMNIVYVDYELPTPKAFPWSGYPDKEGNVWIPEFNTNQVGKLDPKTGVIEEFRVPNPGRAEIHSATPAPDGTVWITESSDAYKLAKFDPRTKQFTEYEDPLAKSGRQFPPDYMTGRKLSALIDREGNVWTSGSPLTFFDRKTEKFKNFLAVGVTYGIDMDKEGNIWFSQLGESKIGKVDVKTGKVTKWSPPTPDSGTRRLKIDSQGMVWFGEYRGGKIGRFDPKTETFKEYPLPGPSPTPYAFGIDKNDRIWYASYETDVIGRLDPKTGAVIEYPMPYVDNSMRDFFMDSQGRMWFGTAGFNKVGYFFVKDGQ